MVKTRQKRKYMPLLAIAVMVVTGLVLALVLSGGKAPTESQAPTNPHEGEVQLNDGAQEVWLPREDTTFSLLYEQDFFTNAKGWPVYMGNDFTALRGIDVSELQGSIDWQQVKQAGIDFAFLRIGFRGYGQAGRLVEDESFAGNLEQAKKNGVKVGAYFFSQAASVEEAVEEAEFCLSILDGRTLDLPVMFDWERVSQEDSRTAAIPVDALHGYGEAFCRTLEESGYEAGLYFNRQLGYYGYHLGELKDYDWWVSDPGTYPAFYYGAAFWQYSVDATVPGIDIIVDMDMWFIPKATEDMGR